MNEIASACKQNKERKWHEIAWDAHEFIISFNNISKFRISRRQFKEVLYQIIDLDLLLRKKENEVRFNDP